MALNLQQERYIANYLRDVALHMDNEVSPSKAQRALDALDARIRKLISDRTTDGVLDADVVRVLDELGPPEKHAAEVKPEAQPRSGGVPEAVWLGVCAHWARQMEIPVRGLRIAAFAVGVVTGPLAVWAYIALFGHRQWQTPENERPAIDYVKLAWNVGACIVIATLLSYVLDYALWAIRWVYQELLDKPLPALEGWDWVLYEGPGYYPLVLFTAIPIAVLSGLPVRAGWDLSLKRLYLAMLTLYGIYMSYGLASMLVGLALQLTQQFGGFDLLEYLPTL